MSAKESAMAVRWFYEGYNGNGQKSEQAVALIPEEFEWTDIAAYRIFRGKAGYRENMARWARAFPEDGKIEISRLMVSDEIVVSEGIGHGTMKGPILLLDRRFEPTGRLANVRFCDVFRLKEGKILSAHTYYDSFTLMDQLDLGQ